MNAIDEIDLDFMNDALGFDGSNNVDGYGPAGVGTFVLDLEQGFKITNKWPFDLQKFQSGKERRISRNDAPQETFDGAARLLDNQPRAVLAQLARYAAQGQAFLFALPHEALEVVGVSGLTVTVKASELALTDWALPGQRCVVTYIDSTDTTIAKDTVIQSVSGSVITLDVAPDATTLLIMPTRPVFFEPQQTFVRYPVTAEVWQVTARAAIFDFAPTAATIPIYINGIDTGARAMARKPGLFGNFLYLDRLQNFAAPATGSLSDAGIITTFQYRDGTTTLGDLANLMASSSNFLLTGTYNPLQVFNDASDRLDQASGGGVVGSVGNGATLTTYSGDGTSRPVWDRPIEGDQASDSIQAMTKIIEHGALAYAIGTADKADFGRAVAVENGLRDVRQWLKLFMSTTKGAQEPFWFPTWRNDLTFVSKNTNVITITTDDFAAWWPSQREHIEIEETSGTITRAKITAATNNGGGSWTLTIGTTLASSSVNRISWLELCRFEPEEFEFAFDVKGAHLETAARAVQP